MQRVPIVPPADAPYVPHVFCHSTRDVFVVGGFGGVGTVAGVDLPNDLCHLINIMNQIEESLFHSSLEGISPTDRERNSFPAG